MIKIVTGFLVFALNCYPNNLLKIHNFNQYYSGMNPPVSLCENGTISNTPANGIYRIFCQESDSVKINIQRFKGDTQYYFTATADLKQNNKDGQDRTNDKYDDSDFTIIKKDSRSGKPEYIYSCKNGEKKKLNQTKSCKIVTPIMCFDYFQLKQKAKACSDYIAETIAFAKKANRQSNLNLDDNEDKITDLKAIFKDIGKQDFEMKSTDPIKAKKYNTKGIFDLKDPIGDRALGLFFPESSNGSRAIKSTSAYLDETLKGARTLNETINLNIANYMAECDYFTVDFINTFQNITKPAMNDITSPLGAEK